jgi:hypothetical protein
MYPVLPQQDGSASKEHMYEQHFCIVLIMTAFAVTRRVRCGVLVITATPWRMLHAGACADQRHQGYNLRASVCMAVCSYRAPGALNLAQL